jgi:flagellar biosynthesis chaperone FliJ
MIKSRNTPTTKSAINNDEMSLLLSEFMDKCDSIEQKLDMLIERQEAKLCQCDDEEGATNELKLP